jgi:hypothetical protein
MKIRKLENISDSVVNLKHKNGAETTLPPGQTLRDIDITNLSEVQGQVKAIHDLTEVSEDSGKTRLDD